MSTPIKRKANLVPFQIVTRNQKTTTRPVVACESSTVTGSVASEKKVSKRVVFENPSARPAQRVEMAGNEQFT